MADDEDRTLADQLPGGGDRLAGIAEIVRRDELYLLAEHAPGGVEVRHGELRAALHLLAEPGILTCHRAGHADQDLGVPAIWARSTITEMILTTYQSTCET